MKRKSLLSAICATFALTLAFNAVADFDGPVIKEWFVMEKR